MVIKIKDLLKAALEYGLTEDEYNWIVQLLGREPNYTELGMYSVMWSEHCSYKNSIAELRKLPREGDFLLARAGEENAGLVDIGEGYAVAFKIESHNHPSAVEPYQGAATGVGGILRDIFTMGARPIAALNSLRFGNPAHPRTNYLVKGIVKGIGDYGNSFGVPTIAGDIYFDDCYNENPLVNAMAVGIVKHSQIARAIAYGEGNLVMLVGSSTGRDGIHGATFASDNLSEESEHKRPSVQVGDPFTEKLLLEATLEAIRGGYVIGIQDLGAAGLTCASSEMSSKGNCGMELDLDKVSLREEDMSEYEVMLSESQERMLLVVLPQNEYNVKNIFKKWDLRCSSIGLVTNNGQLRISKNKNTVVDIPAKSLVVGGGAPVYYRESTEPKYINQCRQLDLSGLPEPIDYNQTFLQMLCAPNICSRNWVYEQYDTMVRTNTIVYGYSDAAVIRIKGSSRGIALKTDCNPRYVYVNPYVGAQIAVAESARNVVCTSAKPVAITNCLNYGNPYNPETFWQFKESIRGISEACRELMTPVTGGNVSFYNESPNGPVYPTPVIGMLGLIDSIDLITTADFKNVGDLIILIGKTSGHIGASEYLHTIHGKVSGDAPPISLKDERRLQEACLSSIREKLIVSCHDVSDGGFIISLAECCIYSFLQGKNLGARISIKPFIRADHFYFGEDQTRILVSISPNSIKLFEEVMMKYNLEYTIIGEVSINRFIINNDIDLEVRQIAERYVKSFPLLK